MRFRNHPTLREAYRSWRLSRDLKSGKAERGRVRPKASPPRRDRWEELKLRLRTLKRAFGFLFETPVLRAPGQCEGAVFPTGRLFAAIIKPDGERLDCGLISTKVVTTAGVGAIVDAFQNSFELENFKYHAAGTGTTAEAAGDTAIETEVESRATGSTTEGASANIYKTVGTVSFTASRAVTEHGVFSASSAGTLLDRSVFSAINVVNGDAIEFTYELTFPAGS